MKKIYLLLAIFTVLFSGTSFAVSISGPTVVCAGSTAAFSNDAPGGTWSTSNPAIATIAGSGYAWFITNGSVILTYTTSGGGSANMTVTVNPNTPITGNFSVCAGGTFFFSNANAGGSWSFTNTASATVNSSTGELTAIAPWGGTITYYNSFGCVSSSTVNISPSPCSSIGPVTTHFYNICGGNDSLYVNYYNCVLYQWQSSPDNVIWTNIGTASYNNPGISVATMGLTYYRCMMTCSGTGGGVVYSLPVLSTGIPANFQTYVAPSPATTCPPFTVYIRSCVSPGPMNVTTFFGDGTSHNMALTPGVYGAETHAYELAGTYTIKHVLYNGTSPIDSSSYPYNYFYCRTIPVTLFLDNNNNCTKETAELVNYTPVDVEIDSNGVKIDTMSVVGGFYYEALGTAGTVYKFRSLSTAFSSSCSSGVLTVTILPYVNTYSMSYLALQGGTGSGFDLQATTTAQCGRHAYIGSISVQNLLTTAQNGVVTLNFSPKFYFYGSTPAPSSVSGTTATWNVSSLSNMAAPPAIITFHLETPGPWPAGWLIPGDTVHNSIVITPTTGDADPSNNYVTRVDTATASWDPNYMEADPANYMLPGAQVQYTIHFENTGNDTAQNIHVMDTLANELDPSSLQIVTASHIMNMVRINDGTHNVIKFDFPNIKLPDSSHHYYSNGFVTYKIMQRPGLTDGTPIMAHAGIFFDENEVVLTEPIQNTIADINGPASLCVGDNITLTELAPGGSWSSSSANATVAGGVVTGVSAGAAIISYTVNYSNGPITVTKLVNVGAGGGSAGTILGPTSVCAGTTITLTNATAGGAWSTALGNASMSGPVVTGMSAGVDTVIYSIGSGVCAARSTLVINVLPQPNPGTLSGPTSVCAGASITISPTIAGGAWSTFGGNVSVTSGVSTIVTGLVAGTDTVYYSVTNSCGTKRAQHVVTINPQPDPGVISGPGTVCVGGTVTMAETMTGGVWATWGPYASISGGVVTGVTPGIDSVFYVVNNMCGAKKATKTINVIICPTSVGNAPQTGEVVIYPNPTTGELTIADANALYKTYTITNEVGQVITEQVLKSRQTNIDITKYAPGVYYITLKGDNGSLVKKITKI